MKKHRRSGGWYASAAALALSAVALAACNDTAASESESSAPEVAPVTRGDLTVTAEAAGQVEPIRLVEVKSRASGEITEILVETGDVVEPGQLLVRIDPRDVRNAFDQAEADLEVARARLATAQAQRQRAAELREANVVTEQEYETAALDQANARAQFIKAETSLQLARERLNDVIIRAPIAGTVIAETIEIGQIIASASQNISGGTTLLTMADLSEMQVRALVDETDLGRIRPGLAVRVKVEAFPDRAFAGQVLKIEPQAVVDQNVTMFPVLVRLDNRQGLLKPGMNADVEVRIADRNEVLLVPNSAIVSPREMMAAAEVLGLDPEALRQQMRPASSAGAPRTGQRALAQEGRGTSGDVRPGVVFVSAEGRIEPRRVMLGVNDWDNTEVVSGLAEGENVILMSVARLQQQQQEFQERVRERTSGPFPGGGRR